MKFRWTDRSSLCLENMLNCTYTGGGGGWREGWSLEAGSHSLGSGPWWRPEGKAEKAEGNCIAFKNGFGPAAAAGAEVGDSLSGISLERHSRVSAVTITTLLSVSWAKTAGRVSCFLKPTLGPSCWSTTTGAADLTMVTTWPVPVLMSTDHNVLCLTSTKYPQYHWLSGLYWLSLIFQITISAMLADHVLCVTVYCCCWLRWAAPASIPQYNDLCSDVSI